MKQNDGFPLNAETRCSSCLLEARVTYSEGLLCAIADALNTAATRWRGFDDSISEDLSTVADAYWQRRNVLKLHSIPVSQSSEQTGGLPSQKPEEQ